MIGDLFTGSSTVLLPEGTTLYRAGHLGWQMKLAFFGITRNVAQNYVLARPDQKRKIHQYQTLRPLRLHRFKSLDDVQKYGDALGEDRNPHIAVEVCKTGVDGWYVREMEHAIGDQDTFAPSFSYGDLYMHEVMVCDLKSLRRVR